MIFVRTVLRLCILSLLVLAPAAQAADRLPRTLLALYNSSYDGTPRLSPVHRFLEMPANHLGYDIQYVNPDDELPQPGAQVAGIVLWLEPGYELKQPEKIVAWLTRAQQLGKKILFIENSGFGEQARKSSGFLLPYNRLLKNMGLQDNNLWRDITYKASVTYANPRMIGFERSVPSPLNPFMDVSVATKTATAHLKVTMGDSGQSSDLVITSEGGGYISPGYAMLRTVTADNNTEVYQWLVNPFEFLTTVLGNSDMPKPDTTTLFGSRIFVAMIDGDGWNQPTGISEYARKSLVAADVVREEIIRPLTDIAFSVGVIAGDLDPECYGTVQGQAAAQKMFMLPNVEPASHSYTHPLNWKYFANYTPEKEVPFLESYPKHVTTTTSLQERILEPARAAWQPYLSRPTKDGAQLGENELVRKVYGRPRLYACMPFDLDLEIRGAADFLERTIMQKGVVRLIQWGGDTQPFEKALIKTRLADLYNIGGGSSPFTGAWYSISGVSPVGLRLGQKRQIYSGYGGESTYTNFWRDGFYGTSHFMNYTQMSDTPRRLSPLIYYFHIAVGSKQASITAVREAIDFATSRRIISLSASNYGAVARGFYNALVTKMDDGRWRINNRGALQTLRFDKASRKGVDFAESTGVVGQKYVHGNLYVFLDPSVGAPIIKIKNNEKITAYPASATPYLLESRWQIRNLIYGKNSLRFAAYGYGPCDMRWKMPEGGQYVVTASRQGAVLYETRLTTDEDGMLNVVLPGFVQANLPLELTISRP